MPRRLIELGPEPWKLKLITGNEIVKHIITKMACINDNFLRILEEKVYALEDEPIPTTSQESIEQEDDVREDSWGAICDFLVPKFAEYAILSHTWLQTESEITYQDFLSQRSWLSSDGQVLDGDMKAGYEKLRGFCDVAYKQYGLSLAWCDTACINKDSSAELDEAIQSMYKWYKNSTICVTYLSDTVSILNMAENNWFRRGWTLQELIAPTRTHFYSKYWTRLSAREVWNDKANNRIQGIISTVTDIPAPELVSFNPLTGSDIATRMFWAANRATTRGEDQAYSLMGIFGVHFPISYGAGAERAFFRLIESIVSSRHTSQIIRIFNWAGKSLSDTIHASRIIPSGPECYRASWVIETEPENPSHLSNFYPALSEPMLLTHLGLRVRLLLVQANFRCLFKHKPEQLRGTFNVDLHPDFPDSPFESGLTVLLDKRFSEIPNTLPLQKPTVSSSAYTPSRRMPTN